VSVRGPERSRLEEILASSVFVEISAIAWYEFCRGPRLPEQVAVARQAFGTAGIIPFDEETAAHAADVFRALGSPRKRAADIAIGVTALRRDARLVSRNAKDFRGLEGLVVEGVG
jgi:predicted nucleic acid-binding protein